MTMMNINFDFQQPIEAVQALMAMQAEVIGKAIAPQKQPGEQLMAFFNAEAEKAQSLKTPEEVVKSNIDSNTALFNLLKTPGEAFTALATAPSNSALAAFQKTKK